MKKFLAAAGATCIVGLLGMQSASGAENGREFADIYTDCGLGAMIAPNSDAVAAVTNVTWDLGTTAISSNATTPDTCQGGKAETAQLIHDVYPQLEQDLARGEGEHLGALLVMTRCDEGVHEELASALRGDLAELTVDSGYEAQSRFQRAEAMHERLYGHVEGEFARACTVG